MTERFGFSGPTLCQERAAEQRRGTRRIDPEPVVAQVHRTQRAGCCSAAAVSPSISSISPAKTSVSRSPCVMPSSSTIRREEAIMRRAASVRPRSASSTAWQRSATASTAGAPWVMRSTRTTSRQRPLARVTGLGPHRAASGAFASTAFERRRSCARRAAASASVERGLARTDLAEPRERERVHRMRLRLAGPVACRRQLRGRGRDRVGRGTQRLRVGEHRELAGEARVPGAQAIRAAREAAELVERLCGGADVAGGEQGLAPVEGQVGTRRIGSVEPLERAPEQARRQRQIVARERPPPRRREVARRALAERAPLRVDRAQLAQVPVRLLEVPADRLVVLDRLADPALDPVGEASVQLRPRALQHPAVRRVADQPVVEPQRRLAEEPGGVGLDQLAAPQRFQPRVEIALRLARQQVRDGRARELPPDDRGPLQHQAVLRAQPLDARREQRVDGRRHLEGGEIDPGGPAIALPFEGAIVDQHAHQLAEEERIALAGGEHASRDRGGQRVGADHVGGEPGRGRGVEAAERHHVGDEPAGRRQRRARVAQLGSRRGEQEKRHAGAPLHQVLDQVEQQRLGPLEVVDREHHRLRRGEPGEQAADDEERLLRRRRRPGQERADAGGDAAPLGVAARHRGIDRRAQVVAAGGRRRRRGRRAAPWRSARRWRRRPPRSGRSSTVAPSRRRANSSSRRDLPRPGDPRTTARRAAGAATAAP